MSRRARHVGRVRERLSEMLVEAFSRIGEECRSDPAYLRPQQGRWRTDFRMDVCRWEGAVELFRHGEWTQCGIHSWSTMTDCVRFGVNVEEGEVYGGFEAFAADDAQRGAPKVSDHVITYLKKEDAEVINRILDEDDAA